MELQQLYGEPIIIQRKKAQILRWMGLVIRMSEKRIPEKIISSAFGGNKKRKTERKMAQ